MTQASLTSEATAKRRRTQRVSRALQFYNKAGGDPIVAIAFAILTDALEGIRRGECGPIVWLVSSDLADCCCQLLGCSPINLLRVIHDEYN